MEWKEVRLGDVVEIVNGFAFKSKAFTLEGIPVIKIKNIKAGKVILNDLDYISTSDINPKYTKIRSSDILITMTGNRMDGSPETWVGKVSLFRHQGDFYLNQRVSALRLIDDSVDNNFLSYYLSSWQSQLYFALNSNSSGGQANITPAVVQEYRLMVPELETQRSIASILSSLDQKIELNNKINADLEEMAQAIFKNWFVDFEPFKDGKFVDSELGMIPEGWKVGTLGDITKNKSAKVKERNDVKVLSPVTTGELVLSEEYFTKQVFSSSIAKYKIVNKGDFAYNPARVNIGSLGRNEFDFDGCVSPVYVVFSVLDGYENYFDLFRKTDFFKDSVASLAIGGVRQSLSYDDLSSIEVIIPSENAVEEFNNLYNQMKKTIKANKLENSRLSLLRDTLLPRLMSGELEVPE